MRRIVRFTPPAPDAGPGALAAIPAARWVTLGSLASADLSGLAFDPASGHLFTLDARRRVLYELALDGTQVAAHDVSAIALADPQAMVFAPSGDQTDDPTALSLFVADAGSPAGRGHVIELAWTTQLSPVSEDASIQATTAVTLVRTVKTSLFSPPSPDPSGIAYDSARGRLIIDDGEVDEMSIYHGKEVFETSLTGSLLRSYSVLSFTNEPVGIAFNPNNRHVFISDDDHDNVFDIDPGPDGLVGTNDDTRKVFKTTQFGSGDAEGLSYDPTGNRIFIADGVNEEVYVVRAGANGTFEGSGDDQITHFDTHGLGIVDNETVEWKSDTGTLWCLSSTGNRTLRETTTTGSPIQTIDLSFANLSKPAGMAYAPSSGGGGMSLYIVNRAVDNNSNANENDGFMVEISVGGTAPSNTPPSVNAGPDATITLPAQAALNGTVTDDGLPSPPTLTTTWSKSSGPGTVTFANANAVDTQASFSASGTYVLQLSASDGQMSTSDLVQITVQPEGTSNAAPTVNAGSDQTITLPAQAALDGTVTDDGQPSPPTLTTTWSKSSGPGTVTFANANAVDTQASFSVAGTYVLRLTASDGSLSNADLVQITVQSSGGGGGTVAEVRIASGADDAEESATGSVDISSSDLELVFDASNQTVGLRFTGLNIARNATIGTAWIQFQADEAQNEATALTIRGQAADNAPVFGTSSGSLAALPRTAASAAWSPAAWATVGEAGPLQRTTDLRAVIQEIVNRPGWASGNALALFITGTGHRTAESYDGAPTAAALLHIELSTVNTPPAVNAGLDQTITLPAQASLDGTVTDDGLPSPPSLTTTWTMASGPGTVTFGNANAVDTQASFSVAGTYVLQLAANDGSMSASDQVQVIVQPAGTNAAPVVSAGPDLDVILPAQATLNGTVTDDGQPTPPTLTRTWSKVSGPGTVTFSNPNAAVTQASFSIEGTYVLQLSASDGALTRTDQTIVTVWPAGTILRRIATGADDAEEAAGGNVSRSGNDLELVYSGGIQTVGLRFPSLAIPQGATILGAGIQFQADETQSEATSLTIRAQAGGTTAAFSNTTFDVSSRPRTTASVSWSPAPWSTIGEAGANQHTPDIKAVIQEIVSRPDWVSGSSIVILITGTGHRTAESYEGTAAGAPRLEVRYQ
jgi:uncharacterized protein YjiK